MNNKEYYVYCFLNPFVEGEFIFGEYTFKHFPFYIGKGYKNRITSHLTESGLKRDTNKKKTNKILKIRSLGKEPIFYKIYESLSEKDALDKEKEIIRIIGKENLTNLTNGGELPSRFNEWDEETQKIVKEKRRNKMLTSNPMKRPEISIKVSQKRKLIKHDDVYKKNMSLSLKNSEKHKLGCRSEENRSRAKESQRKNMKPVFQHDLNMNFIEKFESIKDASRRLNIDKRSISANVNNKQKTCKNFIFKS